MTAYITMTMMFQAIFLLAYDILLKKETFFTYNRIYLILAPLIGLALPFLEIPLLQQNISSMGFVSLPEIIIGLFFHLLHHSCICDKLMKHSDSSLEEIHEGIEPH